MYGILGNRNSMTIHPTSARSILKVRQGGRKAGAADSRAVTEVAKTLPDFRGEP